MLSSFLWSLAAPLRRLTVLNLAPPAWLPVYLEVLQSFNVVATSQNQENQKIGSASVPAVQALPVEFLHPVLGVN